MIGRLAALLVAWQPAVACAEVSDKIWSVQGIWLGAIVASGIAAAISTRSVIAGWGIVVLWLAVNLLVLADSYEIRSAIAHEQGWVYFAHWVAAANLPALAVLLNALAGRTSANGV